METVNSVYIIVGLVGTLIGMIGVLWKIARSVTTTQISVAQIQKDITEIKIIIDKTDCRVDKINDSTIGNTKDIKAAHRRIDEVVTTCRDFRKERLG